MCKVCAQAQNIDRPQDDVSAQAKTTGPAWATPQSLAGRTADHSRPGESDRLVRGQAEAKGLAWAVDRATAGKGALLTAAGLYAALAMAAGSADLANGQEVFDGNCACAPQAKRGV